RRIASLRSGCFHRTGNQVAGGQARPVYGDVQPVAAHSDHGSRGKMRMLPPKYRRIAALGILFVVLALPGAAAVSLIEIWRSNRVEMEERRAAISRFEAIARYAPKLQTQRVRSAEASHAAWFLSGSDPAIAAASLQARLKQLAQDRGIDVAQAH